MCLSLDDSCPFAGQALTFSDEKLRNPPERTVRYGRENLVKMMSSTHKPVFATIYAKASIVKEGYDRQATTRSPF